MALEQDLFGVSSAEEEESSSEEETVGNGGGGEGGSWLTEPLVHTVFPPGPSCRGRWRW